MTPSRGPVELGGAQSLSHLRAYHALVGLYWLHMGGTWCLSGVDCAWEATGRWRPRPAAYTPRGTCP